MRRLLLILLFAGFCHFSPFVFGQISGALQSYNEGRQKESRTQQYVPVGDAFVSESTLDDFLQGRCGANRFTRALYGSHSDWRLETSDRPVFAVVKKNHHRHIRFVVNGVSLDSVGYCRSQYVDGMRTYLLRDQRWGADAELTLRVLALPDREGALWLFEDRCFVSAAHFQARVCAVAHPKLKRNGDIGADQPGVFEASPIEADLTTKEWVGSGESWFVIDSINQITSLSDDQARVLFQQALSHNSQLAQRIVFSTPDPYVNTLGGALAFAADGDWDGQTWLHGCIGWRMPLAGWRAAYVGDVLGWWDRQHSHFDAYAKSQVTHVPPTISHPSQDPKMNLARAEKKWGTQMYSDGYICRNPERNDQMHHYDMNLNYIDELLRHFQFDADTTYMRQMWPVVKRHLAWEKRNYDPDGDHLYDAYCCIWASDALYYSGGAVTHSSAYNLFANRMAARIAELLGEDPTPYADEAIAIDQAMSQRLWLDDKSRWAEYEDAMGLRRLHESAAAWSYYTPVDCGVGTPAQRYEAIGDMRRSLPHIQVENTPYHVIATSNWMPYSWSINNVATAETLHMALACFEAGQNAEGYDLLMGTVMDNMYYGQSPANFGQLSHYDAARGECYRDFGDCIGIASRALVQGLFGVYPDALHGKCFLQPGFPDSWDSVSLKTPYIEYRYSRARGTDRYEVTQNFPQPLTLVLARLVDGQWIYTEGSSAHHQVIEVPCLRGANPEFAPSKPEVCSVQTPSLGLGEPDLSQPFRQHPLSAFFNAEVSAIYHNRYLSPRPHTTTLQIPVQGVGEWCHPQYTPEINDSVFRSLITNGRFSVAGVPFLTPATGPNVVYTSLWDNYPDSVVIPLSGKASSAYLLMAGSTNHMQSHIDNALVVVSYSDGSADTLRLRNPDNWCPIEQDYYVDGRAFRAASPRPYRVALGSGIVSRDLGEALRIKGVYGREIPGGAAQMLCMPLHPRKKLQSLTLRTLSNDVVVGLMGITLQ